MPPVPGFDVHRALGEPVADTIARVRSRSFAAVRLFGTALGVPNAIVTLLVAWSGGSLSPAVVAFVAVQLALIACAWALRSRLDRVGGVLIVSAATVLGLGNLWVWGFTVGLGLMVAWACVACATFYGVRVGLAAWAIAAATLAAHVGLQHAGLAPVPAGLGAVSPATPILVRYVVTIVAVTGILVMMMAALVEGFERATHGLAEAAARERDARSQHLESERRAAGHLLEAQARSYSLLHAAMEATADGLLIVDRDGTVRGANQRFYEMWRLPSRTPADDAGDAQLLDAVAGQLVDPDAFRDKVRELYAHPFAESRDLVTFTDGRVFERVSRPQFLGAVPVGRVWSFRDVTDAREREARLWQAQKMEAIGVLASGIAHEFSNLLTVIGGRAGLIRRQVSYGDPVRGDAEALIAAADRASALTRHLAAFSRRQVLQPRVLDANQVVTDLMGLIVPLLGERTACDLRLAGDLWPVCVDPAQLEQVLLRLVVNARDAMPEGGRILIESRNVLLLDGDPRLQSDLGPGPHVHLAVTDSGPALDADALARVFEPFFVPRAGGGEAGAGLALAMVHGIIGQSGGHISVASDPLQRRTTFDILLPRAGEPLTASAAPQAASLAAG